MSWQFQSLFDSEDDDIDSDEDEDPIYLSPVRHHYDDDDGEGTAEPSMASLTLNPFSPARKNRFLDDDDDSTTCDTFYALHLHARFVEEQERARQAARHALSESLDSDPDMPGLDTTIDNTITFHNDGSIEDVVSVITYPEEFGSYVAPTVTLHGDVDMQPRLQDTDELGSSPPRPPRIFSEDLLHEHRDNASLSLVDARPLTHLQDGAGCSDPTAERGWYSCSSGHGKQRKILERLCQNTNKASKSMDSVLTRVMQVFVTVCPEKKNQNVGESGRASRQHESESGLDKDFSDIWPLPPDSATVSTSEGRDGSVTDRFARDDSRSVGRSSESRNIRGRAQNLMSNVSNSKSKVAMTLEKARSALLSTAKELRSS